MSEDNEQKEINFTIVGMTIYSAPTTVDEVCERNV